MRALAGGEPWGGVMTIQRIRHGAGERANWSTPVWLFKHYNDRYRFTIDLAAEKWNAKCARYFTIEDDALSQAWEGRGFLNPPYNEIAPWVERAYQQTRVKKSAEVVLLLLPARTSRPWFLEIVKPFALVEYLESRVCFDPPPGWGGKKDSPAEDSLVAVFERPWMPRGRKEQRRLEI